LATKVALRALQAFVRDELPLKLGKDLQNHRVTMEADLEVCAYYHLRRYLRRDPLWRIFARKRVPQTGYFVDLLIFRRKFPRLALELKWNRGKISAKDRHSLSRAVDTLGVNKAYFLATCVRSAPYQQIKKTDVEKHKVFEVIISLPFGRDELVEWKRTRRLFKKEMSPGKALKAGSA